MKISIVTLFPDMFAGPFAMSMLAKAQEKGLAEIELIDLRDFGIGPRRQVDDIPYGGGDGMVLRPEPLFAAVESVRTSESTVILLSPQGDTLRQELVQDFSQLPHLILLCGHYEGFDERIRTLADHQISIGDYVLTGGELPAMVLTDAVVRLIPGVLGGERSALDESFSDGVTLEHPHYTRPEEFRGMSVPDVLLSGHHQKIDDWRKQKSRRKNS
ncbi:MAG: tRNA (guanosine(37)-N1)-methyltransferase TrmD [Candidatus Saccharimonadales bacterium]